MCTKVRAQQQAVYGVPKLEIGTGYVQMRVHSRTMQGVVYTVYLDDDGRLECDCVAGEKGSDCWHQQLLWMAIRRELDNIPMRMPEKIYRMKKIEVTDYTMPDTVPNDPLTQNMNIRFV